MNFRAPLAGESAFAYSAGAQFTYVDRWRWHRASLTRCGSPVAEPALPFPQLRIANRNCVVLRPRHGMGSTGRLVIPRNSAVAAAWFRSRTRHAAGKENQDATRSADNPAARFPALAGDLRDGPCTLIRPVHHTWRDQTTAPGAAGGVRGFVGVSSGVPRSARRTRDQSSRQRERWHGRVTFVHTAVSNRHPCFLAWVFSFPLPFAA